MAAGTRPEWFFYAISCGVLVVITILLPTIILNTMSRGDQFERTPSSNYVDTIYNHSEPLTNVTQYYERMKKLVRSLDYMCRLENIYENKSNKGEKSESVPLHKIVISGGIPKPVILIMNVGFNWLNMALSLQILRDAVVNPKYLIGILTRFDLEVIPIITDPANAKFHNDRSEEQTDERKIDFMKNFDYRWDEKNTGALHEEAFSEPESRFVRDYILNNQNRIEVILTHDLGNDVALIEYPVIIEDKNLPMLEYLATAAALATWAKFIPRHEMPEAKEYIGSMYYWILTRTKIYKVFHLEIAAKYMEESIGFVDTSDNVLKMIRTWARITHLLDTNIKSRIKPK